MKKARYSLYSHPSLTHDVWLPTGQDASATLPAGAEKITGRLMTTEEFEKLPALTLKEMTGTEPLAAV